VADMIHVLGGKFQQRSLVADMIHILGGKFQQRSLAADSVFWVVLNEYITYYLHGAKLFLRSRQLCSYSRTFQHIWIPKFHYRVHKCPQLDPILSQINPVHNPILSL
jgi:hypothetical protein